MSSSSWSRECLSRAPKDEADVRARKVRWSGGNHLGKGPEVGGMWMVPREWVQRNLRQLESRPGRGGIVLAGRCHTRPGEDTALISGLPTMSISCTVKHGEKPSQSPLARNR